MSGNPACPVCQSTHLRLFLELPQVPVHCNLLWDSRSEALNVPRGDICLAFCMRCSHVFNTRFDPARMNYSGQYENALDFSPRFQSYIQALAAGLVERFGLRGKEILEIGSGQGEFLRLLCEIGRNHGTGFDPASPAQASANATHINLIQEPYSNKYASLPADLICARQTLEHIEQPRDFLTMLRQRPGNRPGAVLFVEVPNLLFILRQLSIWDIIYEHPSYYNHHSLASLFRLAGCQPLGVAETFGGQFLTLEAISKDEPEGLPAEEGESLVEEIGPFFHKFQEKLATWHEIVDSACRSGKKTVVWGTGSKGVSFLNLLKPGETIAYAVDINPRKHGKYVAGTGQEIVPPDFLPSYRPDLIIVMNALYENEIRARADRLELHSEFLLA